MSSNECEDVPNGCVEAKYLTSTSTPPPLFVLPSLIPSHSKPKKASRIRSPSYHISYRYREREMGGASEHSSYMEKMKEKGGTYSSTTSLI